MMEPLQIRPLEPGRLGDYLALFDGSFADFPDWGGCYCAYYDAPAGQPFDPVADAPSHREQRCERIRRRKARGLLAYAGERPVGWCNVAPRSMVPNLRVFGEAIEDSSDDPALIMCFVIHPEHRGRGVASALLQGAIAVSREWGAPWLEGYPRSPHAEPSGLPESATLYKGPLEMYRKAGFEVVRDMGSWLVVRHDLALG